MPGKLKRKASEISPDLENKTKTPSHKHKKMKMNDDTPIQIDPRFLDYPTVLTSQDYKFKECGAAGDCLFLSCSFLLGDIDHETLRSQVCDYLKNNLGTLNGFFMKTKTP